MELNCAVDVFILFNADDVWRYEFLCFQISACSHFYDCQCSMIYLAKTFLFLLQNMQNLRNHDIKLIYNYYYYYFYYFLSSFSQAVSTSMFIYLCVSLSFFSHYVSLALSVLSLSQLILPEYKRVNLARSNGQFVWFGCLDASPNNICAGQLSW